MSRVALLLVCCALVACGKSEEQIRQEVAAEQAEQKRLADVQQAQQLARRQEEEDQASRDRAARIAEAEGFIKSKFREQSDTASNDSGAAAHAWSIDVIKLEAASWQWNEIEYAGVANGYGSTEEGVTRLTYLVDPRELSSTVRVTTYLNYPAIRIDCRSTRCIRVTGVAVNTNDGTNNVDEQRDYNLFPLTTRDEAQRVATAMNVLLTEYGAAAGY